MEALDLIMKDDNLGFGDKIGCCPKCEKEFSIPINILFSQNKPNTYPCKHCGQLIKIK